MPRFSACRFHRFVLGGAILTLAWLLLLALTSPGTTSAETLAPGFDDQPVATVPRPTALAFTPDGRLLVTGKQGRLFVKHPADANVSVALDLSNVTCVDVERGQLGLAVDPDFASNHYIYIYYTFEKYGTCDRDTSASPVNRISRFVLSDADVVNPGSETVLVDNIPSPDGIHNAGDLGFGSDGYLYASVGDGGCDFRGDSGCYLVNDAARDLGGLSGKILRITPSGGIPTDNPFTGPDSDRCNVTGSTSPARKCREVFAYGLRNPFRFSFDPNTTDTRLFINDVGQDLWEELDLGQPGADFGWEVREGPCALNSTTDCGPPPVGMTNPIYWYNHNTGCTSMTGSAVVPNGIWPRQFDGAYLYSDSVCGKILMIPPPLGGATLTPTELVGGLTAPIDLAFGPEGSGQALYYLVFGNYPNDEVRKVVYTGNGNRTPRAVATASPTDGALPLDVSFDGAQSSDPDADPLAYDWNFGDRSAHGAGAQVSHTYKKRGTYTATLTVSDGHGGTDSATIRIDAGNHAPVPTIITPDATKHFSAGEDITLSGTATDAEDGNLGAAALSWEVIKHHATHTHPFLALTPGNNIQIVAPQPEDLASTTNTYLEIRLTGTDSKGRQTTVVRSVLPVPRQRFVHHQGVLRYFGRRLGA